MEEGAALALAQPGPNRAPMGPIRAPMGPMGPYWALLGLYPDINPDINSYINSPIYISPIGPLSALLGPMETPYGDPVEFDHHWKQDMTRINHKAMGTGDTLDQPSN